MTNQTKLLLAPAMLFLLGTGIASAQATRTWISGVGDDANPCSRTAPCKTFAGAISKTSAAGEIDVLDPGGFGAVTITKSITLDGSGGFVGSILASGTNAITVNAGATDVVTLRNLSIQGINAGLSGIKFVNGKVLHIEHCSISQFTVNGIDLQPTTAGASVFVSDTISEDNGGAGLYALGVNGLVQVTLDNVRLNNNANGVLAADYSRFSIRNTAASGSSQVGFAAIPNAGSAVLSIVNSTAANNNIGIQSGGGSSPANIRLAGVSTFLSTTGLSLSTNGTISSFGNNYNSGSGSPNANLPPQ